MTDEPAGPGGASAADGAAEGPPAEEPAARSAAAESAAAEELPREGPAARSPAAMDASRAASGTGEAVEARPAATVVLLRPGPAGLEVLLTHRPTTMAFAADMHVFPGGRVDPADADPELAARSVIEGPEAVAALGGGLGPGPALAAHVAAIRELFEEAGVLLAETAEPRARVREARSALVHGAATFLEIAETLDLRLRTDQLVPLSRWVTPVGFARRFDARFFAAMLPAGAEPTFEGGEVVAHAWLRPAEALTAMAEGRLGMWPPTSATLQQLEHAGSIEEIRERLSPRRLGRVDVERLAPDLIRIAMPAGGGVAGQPVCAYLVGRRRLVLIDPGDPTGPATDRAIEAAASARGTIEAVALTHVDPDHAAGAESVAERLGLPIVAGPGGGRVLPYPVTELGDGDLLAAGDLPIRAIHTPGPRPDHLAFVVGDGGFVITGDLDGVRGSRMLPGAPDPRWAGSVARLERLAPAAVRLPGHPSPAGTGISGPRLPGPPPRPDA